MAVIQVTCIKRKNLLVFYTAVYRWMVGIWNLAPLYRCGFIFKTPLLWKNQIDPFSEEISRATIFVLFSFLWNSIFFEIQMLKQFSPIKACIGVTLHVLLSDFLLHGLCCSGGCTNAEKLPVQIKSTVQAYHV